MSGMPKVGYKANKMNYCLLIIPTAILSLFAWMMFINRKKPEKEIEPVIDVNESEFYDDNLD